MSLFLFAHSGDDARLRSVGALVAAAAAVGSEVTVVFEHEALRRLAAGDLDAPEGAGDEEVPGAAALLTEARRLGGVRYLACPTAIKAAGLIEDEVRGRVDEIVGLASIVERMEQATSALFV